MEFPEQIEDPIKRVKVVKPSWLHPIYWLKWHFIVKPKMMKAMQSEMARIVDDINRPSVIGRRIHKLNRSPSKHD